MKLKEYLNPSVRTSCMEAPLAVVMSVTRSQSVSQCVTEPLSLPVRPSLRSRSPTQRRVPYDQCVGSSRRRRRRRFLPKEREGGIADLRAATLKNEEGNKRNKGMGRPKVIVSSPFSQTPPTPTQTPSPSLLFPFVLRR